MRRGAVPRRPHGEVACVKVTVRGCGGVRRRSARRLTLRLGAAWLPFRSAASGEREREREERLFHLSIQRRRAAPVPWIPKLGSRGFRGPGGTTRRALRSTGMLNTQTVSRLFIAVSLAGCGGGNDASPTREEPASSGAEAVVGLFGDNAVAFVDLSLGKVLATVPVTAPDGIAITPDGAKVYVSSNSTGTVAVIDPAARRLLTSVPVGMQPAGLSVTPDGRYVVVAVQGDGEAVVIDTSNDGVVAHAAVGKAHTSLTNPDGTLAFVASQATDAPAVQVVDVPSATLGATFALEAGPRALAELHGVLFASLSGSADIAVLDATTGTRTGSVTTGGSPHDVRPTADGASILTVSQTAGELEIIDPAALTLAASVPTGAQPHWIAVAPDGTTAYVTNEGDNDLAVVDLKARAVTKKFPVGTAPRKLVLRP
jgi:YVTN family beta-propeller protein